MINVESESSDKLEIERDEDERSIHCRLCHQIYREPKLLHCGHSFCRQCIDQSIIDNGEKTDESSSLVQCSICQEINEFDDLDDFLLVRRIEDFHNERGTLECRACTSNDRAVAHCSTCFDYLCLKCCQAHQYMKCFEQHQVRYLNERDEQDQPSTNNRTDDLEQIRSNFDKFHRSIDEQRSLSLSTLDTKLTDLHKIYQENKEKIESVHRSLQKIIDEVQGDLLSQLSDAQRQEEMHLIEQIEITQRDSHSFDELVRTFDLYADKCSLEQIDLVQRKFFQPKLDEFDRKFRRSTSDKDRSNVLLLESSSIDDVRQSFAFYIDKFIKNSSNVDEQTGKGDEKIDLDQARSFLSSQMTNGTDSGSSSSTSGISSLPQAVLSSSSNGTDHNSTGLSPSAINKDEFFLNSNSSIEPVVENLRALESIFAEQMTNEVIHPNLQRNIEEILHLNSNNVSQPAAPYSILTRQTSAPSLGQRSPSSSSNLSHIIGQNILSTYSSTNSGGSTNGNNSRSTTPFSSVHLNLNCPMELNYGNLSQNNSNRRSGQSMQVRAKFGSLGPQKCQFNAPHGFCLGIDEEIIVADTNNHRIQIFDKTGEFKYQFGIPGKEEGQLWYPRKVASIRVNGKFVVCDRGNERSRMQIFTRNGHFIKKISIRYIDIVAGLAITQQGHIVAVDSVSPTVFCISESGDLLKWFDCSDYMREPSDIAIFNNEYFVCDFKGHCVVVFDEDGNFIRRIGNESITNFPNGIDISDAGDVIIGDSHGNRFHIAVYSRQGDFLQEFDCPYVKVSRCCGLKITSDGFIVTLAKNNHHVLVLNTLYLP